MHPKQTNEQPLYMEILWEWRAFGRHIEPKFATSYTNLTEEA